MAAINPIISEILKKRGICDEADIEEFLSDKPLRTYDPFLLNGVSAGVDLVLSEIDKGHSICIYGDYDADGITSIGILYNVLSQLTDKLSYYVPSRFDEGYGLNRDALKSISDSGVDMVITVDCGSTSYNEIQYAIELGLKMLVTDHHNITDVNDNCIIINPKKEDAGYPFEWLAGCGVAFKLAQGIQRKAGLPKHVINDVLDLLAIGTVGDVVPLVDENRTFAKYGIRAIRNSKRQGLKKLIEGLFYEQNKADAWQIAFGIVPSLNATGRISHAKLGVELMLEEDVMRAKKLTEQVIECNKKRKNIQEQVYCRCIDIVERDLLDDLFLVIEADDVHEGVAGIVAGKIKDLYERPVAIIMQSGGVLKGTGRSGGNVDLHATLSKFEHLFERFGGHKGACGFSIKHENMEMFKEGLRKEMEQQYAENPNLFDDSAKVDLVLTGRDVTLELAMELDKLGPFGCQNPEPIFAVEKVKPVEIFEMGSDHQHLRFKALCPDGAQIECVLFNKAKQYNDILHRAEPVNLIGKVKWQEWKGNLKVQMIIDDIKG